MRESSLNLLFNVISRKRKCFTRLCLIVSKEIIFIQFHDALNRLGKPVNRTGNGFMQPVDEIQHNQEN